MGRRTLRVVTLRPGTRVAFSTNRFHETWHVVSGPRGARYLARLLWGLAYQRRPDTLVLIRGEHLRATPFEGEASQPILLCNADLGVPGAKLLRALGASLRRAGAPARTLRWRSEGLDRALADEDAWRLCPDHYDPVWRRETMTSCGGILRYAAPASVLRWAARAVAQLDPSRFGSDHVYLASHGAWPAGEVQIFARYGQMLSVAAEARREVCAEGGEIHPSREAVWDRCERVARRRRRSYRSRALAQPS